MPEPLRPVIIPLLTATVAAVSSETVSLNVTCTGMSGASVGSGAVVERETVGEIVSKFKFRGVPGMQGFPAKSSAAPASTLTMISPCPEGITSKKKSRPKPVILAAAPLLTTMPKGMTSATDSEKLRVTGTGARFVLCSTGDHKNASGGLVSYVRVNGGLGVLVINSGHVATPSGTKTVTSPSDRGVRSNV